MNYTDPNYMVCCPVDGTTEKSIKDLKLLKNLILDVSGESEEKMQFSAEKTNKNVRQNIPDSKLFQESTPSKNKQYLSGEKVKFIII